MRDKCLENFKRLRGKKTIGIFTNHIKVDSFPVFLLEIRKNVPFPETGQTTIGRGREGGRRKEGKHKEGMRLEEEHAVSGKRKKVSTYLDTIFAECVEDIFRKLRVDLEVFGEDPFRTKQCENLFCRVCIPC
jgi:hypothetical protein